MAAAQATSSGDVLGTLTSGEISCPEWTTLEIASNRLKLVGAATTTYKLDNARFAVGEDGVFRSDVPIEFTGDNLPDVVRGILRIPLNMPHSFLAYGTSMDVDY